jgi:hypothetical protein
LTRPETMGTAADPTLDDVIPGTRSAPSTEQSSEARLYAMAWQMVWADMSGDHEWAAEQSWGTEGLHPASKERLHQIWGQLHQKMFSE